MPRWAASSTSRSRRKRTAIDTSHEHRIGRRRLSIWACLSGIHWMSSPVLSPPPLRLQCTHEQTHHLHRSGCYTRPLSLLRMGPGRASNHRLHRLKYLTPQAAAAVKALLGNELLDERVAVRWRLVASLADDPEACYADRKPKFRMCCG